MAWTRIDREDGTREPVERGLVLSRLENTYSHPLAIVKTAERVAAPGGAPEIIRTPFADYEYTPNF